VKIPDSTSFSNATYGPAVLDASHCSILRHPKYGGLIQLTGDLTGVWAVHNPVSEKLIDARLPAWRLYLAPADSAVCKNPIVRFISAVCSAYQQGSNVEPWIQHESWARPESATD
jgi:hypothetical protein